jgi:two-component system, chemotaxis family, CheB/CheR fusion protein
MDKNKPPEHHAEQSFPVVGIGASAGGLAAFKKLVKNIAADSGMAYVLVQHLAPSHESLLPEILQRETTLPVHEITNDINLAPNHIYIIPENKILTAYDGKLKIDPRQSGAINMAIDLFFNSLAEVHKSFSRGVLLSGTGYDGTMGLKAIKEGGGCTFVQNPDDALFDGMPLSAIRAGAADFVMEAEDIPLKLKDIDMAYENNHAYNDGVQDIPKNDEEIYQHIVRLLKMRTGNDFSHYKQPTIRRRIARRMVITKTQSAQLYLKLLRDDVTEQDRLFNDILIPVSYFFRDTKIFDTLTESVIPDIIKNKLAQDSLRIWVAGCSTGEEAYSIAILVHECLAGRFPDLKVQVFASDISEYVISKARTGSYNAQEVRNISEARLKAYFTKVEGVYHVKKEIREMCIFAVHNFVKDPPFAKMDLISCRNVLIYLDPYLQKKALNTFHYALRKSGILFLGKSESLGTGSSLFTPFVKNQKIYLRKDTRDKYIKTNAEDYESGPFKRQQDSLKKTEAVPDMYKLANDILFSEYTPAGIIINAQNEIVHFHSNTEPYLYQPPGKPNFNVFKMLRDGIDFELRNALIKAKSTNAKVIKENIAVKDKDYSVTFEVIPLATREGEHYMILFRQIFNAPLEKKTSQKKSDIERIKQLEAEINQMRDDIRRVTEDQEAANEELQSANEELLSNSEELQTLNEELETSAEELQSNNEELASVNDELLDRQEQLTVARRYSEAIIETIREPLIVLNKEMRVRSANASFYRYFKTTEQEIEGKLLYDIGAGQWNVPDFRDQLSRVLPDRLKLDDIELETDLPGIGPRIVLLNIRPIINDGLGEPLILVAIEDITSIRAANMSLLQSNRELEDNNKELTSFSYIASHDLQEPLRKIHAFAKMIADDAATKLSEDCENYIERILVSTSRMRQLIDALLHYSHIGKLDDVELKQINLGSIVEDTIADFRDIVDNTGALISLEPLPAIKLIPTLIHQVFYNLIGNALKYRSKTNKPVIHIDYELTDTDTGLGGENGLKYFKITVADNGIGFPQQQAERIFEPFQRLHGKDNYEGTGIGLAICKKIMIKHKGYITAESVPGKGSKFNLYFPY